MLARYIYSAALLLLAGLSVTAQTVKLQPDAGRSEARPYVSDAMLVERDFPLLNAMLENAAVRRSLLHEQELQTITRDRLITIEQAMKNCGQDASCLLNAARFSPEQVSAVSAVLRRMEQNDISIRSFMRERLKPRQIFTISEQPDSTTLLAESWQREAAAINNMLDVYGAGKAPRYPSIDSMTLDPHKGSFLLVLRDLLETATLPAPPMSRQSIRSPRVFFEPSLFIAVRLMMANGRDEAGRDWPLSTGLNAAAFRRSTTIHWEHYKYSVIVVPGAGLEYSGSAISPAGRERVRLAVAAYRTGQAPFILVSGGYVHPSQTSYCEALEMRRYLMQVYGLPSSSILVDPYARHTTTNLRNAAREVFWYSLPETKPMLIVSDRSQIDYISHPRFLERSSNELHYQPTKLGRRLSFDTLEALPEKDSLFIDPMDPLDP